MINGHVILIQFKNSRQFYRLSDATFNDPINFIFIILFSISELINMHFDECSFNPKLTKMQDILLEVLGNDENGRGIIFVKTRLLAQYLIKWMKSTDVLQVLNPTPFVGQNAPSELGGKILNSTLRGLDTLSRFVTIYTRKTTILTSCLLSKRTDFFSLLEGRQKEF